MTDLSLQPERDLDIRNLFFAVLRKWRFILVFMLICGIFPALFTGFTGIRKLRNVSTLEQTNKQASEAWDNYKKSLSTLTAESANIKEQIERQTEYKNTSYILSMNPTRVYKYAVTYKLNNEYTNADGQKVTNGNIAPILTSYTSIVKNMTINASELPSQAGKSNDRPDSLNPLIVFSQDNGAKTLILTVSAATAEDAEYFINAVIRTIDENASTVTSKLGQHSMEIVSKNPRTDTDSTVNSLSQSFTKDLNTLQSTLTTVSKQLEALSAPELKEYNLKTVITSAITSLIVGLIAGCFLAVFIVSLLYLTADKITGTNEFVKHFPQLPVLGALPRSLSSRFGHKIDEQINRFEDPVFARNTDRVHAAIAAKLEAVAGEKEIVILGETSHPDAPKFVESVKALLSGRSITFVDNLSTNVDAVRAARGKATILLVSRDHETYRNLLQELEALKMLGNEVLGVVIA